MAEQVGVMSRCIKALDGLSFTNVGRSLKTWWNFEDFLEGISLYQGIWTISTGGVGSSFTGTGTAQRFGIAQFNTGTTAIGRCAANMGIWAPQNFLFGGGEYTLETDIYIPDLSTAAEEFSVAFGFGDTITADQVDGAYFYYDRALAGVNWRLKTANNSARTDTDSGVVVTAGAWIRLKVVVNALGTLVTYSINDVIVGTNTLNIPTGAGRNFGGVINIVKTVGITSRALWSDWIWTHCNLSVTR